MKYRFAKPLPWKHQVKGLKAVLANDGRAALFVEMRLGKSRIAIDAANVYAVKGEVTRVLIFCPLSSVGIWKREIKRFTPPELRDLIEWRVVNYENAYARAFFSGEDEYERGWIAVDNEELQAFDPDMVIADESQIIGNTSSVTHRKVYKTSKGARRRLLLTGTPGKPEKIFAQFRILDESVFGSSNRAFEAEYCKMGGWMNKQIEGYRNEDKFVRKIAPYVFSFKEEDAWDVPKTTNEIVPVTLRESYPTYTQMQRDAVVMLAGQQVTAKIVLTQILRLSQITSGHLPLQPLESKHRAIKRRTGREKEQVYRSHVEHLLNNGREKIVTFARFKPDIAICARAAMAAGADIFLLHGSVPQEERDRRIADFDEWVNPCVFIAQIATGSMSLDLAAASDVIYYSLDRSLINYQQSKARVRGHRQKKPITYWHLLAEGTVDEVMYISLLKQWDIVDMVLRHPELLRRSQANENRIPRHRNHRPRPGAA